MLMFASSHRESGPRKWPMYVAVQWPPCLLVCLSVTGYYVLPCIQGYLSCLQQGLYYIPGWLSYSTMPSHNTNHNKKWMWGKKEGKSKLPLPSLFIHLLHPNWKILTNYRWLDYKWREGSVWCTVVWAVSLTITSRWALTCYNNPKSQQLAELETHCMLPSPTHTQCILPPSHYKVTG